MRHQSADSLIRVVVSDDTRMHTELLADALKRDGQLQVTTSTSGSEGLIGRLNRSNTDVLLIGSNLDEQPGRGFEVVRGLCASSSDVPAVLLLDSSKREVVVEAFRAGARGVFSRHESVEILSKCVRRVHEGQIWANSHQMAVLVQELASSHNVRAVDAKGMNLLSKREMEIVQRVARGLTNREIADSLGLSPHTIKNCLFRVFDKLGISSRVELLFMTLSRDRDVQSGHEQALGGHPDQKPREAATLVACHDAADQGGIVAQLTLAQLYSARNASPADALQAYKWHLIVAEQISRDLKEAANDMTIDQLRQAQQAAADWLNQRRKVSSITQKRPAVASVTGHPPAHERSQYD